MVRVSSELSGVFNLGACELFRPAALVTHGPLSPCLAQPLRSAGVEIIDVAQSQESDPASKRACTVPAKIASARDGWRKLS